ncbi:MULTISPECIES: alpha/beta fold hydrolase [unclassified Streptomyces]|uniref:alpha/beta fold hydrolase n=1 Tax=unclassified Streptomyces TaxID=2593676 RepID=UPI0011CACE66|nr:MULTISPECIES: alpha/beta hydrolase [unclassified Streptomyces]TXS08707.1 alpha/beta hydrolase [Streptomyces sp. wa22]WSQ80253.1 alpha/beta hydrolase [Streptomyces sp. NBC_01213]WSQ87584.1 alpha/beta hydrolase [Streptomyces sp. NBC_01212]WSR50987.1 alpha/beta hydrolase [Streptomyces sp. NBC_01201]
MIPYEEIRVPVTGGELAALRWPARDAGAPVVVALHGITANALSWGAVARLLAGRVTLVAPDLRGRAGSSGLPGPYGIAAHADDAAAVAGALGRNGVVLAGHSMGAFVAALAAVRHPDRFGPVVLVDGGFGFPAPTHLSADELMTAVIGPAMDRLSMTFPDRDAYRSFWRAHPAFAGDAWSPEVDAYIQRDLTGEEPALRSGCRLEAVRTDGVGLFTDEVLAAAGELPGPATLLWARRGLMDEEQGLYDESRLAAAGQPGTNVTAVRVEDVNHYTVLTGDKGAGEIAGALLRAVAVPR